MAWLLAKGASVTGEPPAPAVASAEAREQLTDALDRAKRLLDRRSAARRAELAEGLQELTDALQMLEEDGSGK